MHSSSASPARPTTASRTPGQPEEKRVVNVDIRAVKRSNLLLYGLIGLSFGLNNHKCSNLLLYGLIGGFPVGGLDLILHHLLLRQNVVPKMSKVRRCKAIVKLVVSVFREF